MEKVKIDKKDLKLTKKEMIAVRKFLDYVKEDSKYENKLPLRWQHKEEKFDIYVIVAANEKWRNDK